MPEHLSPAWLDALADAGRRGAAPPEVRLVLQQVVVDDDGTEVAYAVRIGDGAIDVVMGRADDADVTFTQDRATAAAIAAGTLSAQAAFLAGRLRIGGDLSTVQTSARDLATLDDVFAAARGGH